MKKALTILFSLLLMAVFTIPAFSQQRFRSNNGGMGNTYNRQLNPYLRPQGYYSGIYNRNQNRFIRPVYYYTYSNKQYRQPYYRARKTRKRYRNKLHRGLNSNFTYSPYQHSTPLY